MKAFLPHFVTAVTLEPKETNMLSKQTAKIRNVTSYKILLLATYLCTDTKPNLVVCSLQNMARPLAEDVCQYQEKIMCCTSLQDYLAKLLLEYQQKYFVICLLCKAVKLLLDSGLLTNERMCPK